MTNPQNITTKELQNAPTATLIALSLETGNRQFSLACSLMAEAQKAFALGDRETALAYGRKAATALLRSQEDERAHVRRAMETAAKVAEKVG